MAECENASCAELGEVESGEERAYVGDERYEGYECRAIGGSYIVGDSRRGSLTFSEL